MPAAYDNFRGEPFSPGKMGSKPVNQLPTAEEAAKVTLASADLDAVLEALAIGGTARSKTWWVQLLKNLGRSRDRGGAFNEVVVGAALRRLVDAGSAVEVSGGGLVIADAALQTWMTESLTPDKARPAIDAWAWASHSLGLGKGPPPAAHFRNHDDILPLARLVLHAGLDLKGYQQLGQRVLGFAFGVPELLFTATVRPFVPALFDRMDDGLRSHLIDEWLSRSVLEQPIWQPLLRWLDERISAVDTGGQTGSTTITSAMRLANALWRLHGGDVPGGLQRIEALPAGPARDIVGALAMAFEGRWVEASEAFAVQLAALAKMIGRRKSLLPARDLRWVLLSLLAQSDAKAWATARKLALAESGTRTISPRGWGLWALAVNVRLGDEAKVDKNWGGLVDWNGIPSVDNPDRLVLAAWLGVEPHVWTPEAVAAIVANLEGGHELLRADLVRQAAARMGLEVPPVDPTRRQPWPVAYFGAPREKWRDALQAMAALAPGRLAEATERVEPTLRWTIMLDSEARAVDLQAQEFMITGPRGRTRLKSVSAATLARRAHLDPRDAAVVRSIDKTWYSSSGLGFDIAAAVVALVGHPAVFLNDQPEQVVDLHEGMPELEVRRVADAQGVEHFEFHLIDPVLSTSSVELGDRWTSRTVEVEREKRDSIRIVREGADRAKLIRLTPAQRRVAELVAQRWTVPVQAKAELDTALRALAGHFQLLSDAAAGQSVPGDARLCAQLVPRREALQLRLAARPFGSFGPLLVPGRGRARVMTVHEGLELSTLRDLDAEQRNLAEVMEALPFLGDADEGDASWQLDDPEHSLTAIERLPALPGIAALEWPRGKPVRVMSASPKSMKVGVTSGTDWFALDGELRVDETRVISLQRLMTLVQESRQGRFVAIGEGEYLALTERLRAQLADLAAMSQSDRGGLRLPKAAAGFLAGALEGVAIEADADWSARMRHLEEAATLQPEVPAGLQAELRSYQAEGHAWMMRMAHAGLGAVLADDMGLGKTVQTLALLVARAALGPALVIAPTSVCGNWVAEAARFAPGLRVRLFGEGERAALLEDAAAGDLVVASYGLALIESESFAARHWATLVLDEAQALKNAATQRAKAIGLLQADFRLALTGTPVENRLTDLWSIMNLLNPGLLGPAQRFAERFANPIERGRDEVARARLRRLVSPFLLRRTKAQVLTDLPPRTEMVLRVEPGAEERHFLEASRRSAIERIASIDTQGTQAAFQVLTELMRLRRAACDPRLAAPELALVGAKVQAFEQLALELVAGRHKALVFSQFTDFLSLMSERLRAAGIAHHMLTGSTPAAERTRRVAAFQAGEGDLFLISLKAGGFGLNLTAADYVIIADPWWNPAAEDQASGRAHRMGQQRPVTVYRLVTAGSIEERILELHARKRELADGLLEGQDQGRPIGADELRELLTGE